MLSIASTAHKKTWYNNVAVVVCCDTDPSLFLGRVLDLGLQVVDEFRLLTHCFLHLVAFLLVTRLNINRY